MLFSLHTMSKQKSGRGLVLLTALAMVSWGGAWPSGKLVAGLASPQLLIFWRFLATTLLLLPLLRLLHADLRLSARDLLLLTGGAGLMTAYNQCFFAGLDLGLAGAGGVLVTSVTPLATFGLVALFHRRRICLREALGLLLGLAGGAVLLEAWNLDLHRLLDSGNLFFLLCGVLWAGLTVLSQHIQKRIAFMAYSFYIYALSTLMALLLALPGGLLAIQGRPGLFWLNIGYLSCFATAFGATVYFLAAGRLGSHRAGSFLFLVPASALLLSWLVLGEVPSLPTLLGGAAAVAAVYTLNRPEALSKKK
jgi:drug/metabolite transporter (DMT)-like permease